jgi:hypothetical protein
MKRVFVPTQGGSDWQRLLAKPDLHWKLGRSAMTAAACWDTAGDRLPSEIYAVLDKSGLPQLQGLKLLAAIPEWEVALPGGSRSSFTDVLALASNERGLCAIAVEAKAGEDFGPTLAAKMTEPSAGQDSRLTYLQKLLGRNFDPAIRYQLLHRTASALLIARDFHASTAVMLVHSWNSSREQHGDFAAFAKAMDARPVTREVCVVERFESPALALSWCDGDPSHLERLLPTGI